MNPTLDAGCGYLPYQAKREGIGIDLQRGRCDLVGDIQHLPFRSEVFDKVYARNILEHLDNPIEGLNELKRVMTKGAKISITIPIHHNPCVDELIKFIFNFPFRIPKTLGRLMHWKRAWKNLGSLHKNRITINEVSKFFQVIRYGSIHPNYSLIRAFQKVGIIEESIRAWIPAHNCYIFATKS